MCKKQKSLEVLVTSMRHKTKIKNTCIDAECFYYLRLGLGLALNSTLQKLQRFIALPRLIVLDTSAHPFQPGDWLYVKWWDSYPCKLSGEDHSKS